jgi:small subunit ribosomal protein S20
LTFAASLSRGTTASARPFGFCAAFYSSNEDFMANTPQAKKRIRRNAKRETINHSRVSRIRTFIKQVESAIESGKKKEAAEALKMMQPEMARGVSRGVIHKNTAARKFSRLSKRVASLG